MPGALELALFRTVGIDLSITATGIARSDGACALIGRDKVTTRSWATRIRQLDELAHEIIETAVIVNPVAAVIEGLDMAQAYGGQIERSYLWCQVVRGLLGGGVHVWVAPSPQVKMYATGKGSGPKAAVIDAVALQWPWFKIGRNDNLADAASCAAIARAVIQEPFELTVNPARQRAALAKVTSVFDDPTPKARKPRSKPTSGFGNSAA